VNEPVRFYAYVELDKSATPPLPLSVSLTRAAAREKIEEKAAAGQDVAQLRVRRAKVTTFES